MRILYFQKQLAGVRQSTTPSPRPAPGRKPPLRRGEGAPGLGVSPTRTSSGALHWYGDPPEGGGKCREQTHSRNKKNKYKKI